MAQAKKTANTAKNANTFIFNFYLIFLNAKKSSFNFNSKTLLTEKFNEVL